MLQHIGAAVSYARPGITDAPRFWQAAAHACLLVNVEWLNKHLNWFVCGSFFPPLQSPKGTQCDRSDHLSIDRAHQACAAGVTI
eukprot:364197-Chlamydomonas_euryale.AAC.36